MVGLRLDIVGRPPKGSMSRTGRSRRWAPRAFPLGLDQVRDHRRETSLRLRGGGRRGGAARFSSEAATSTRRSPRRSRSTSRATPILEWTWKVVQLPQAPTSASRRRPISPLHIYVIWPRFPGHDARPPDRIRVGHARRPLRPSRRSRKTGTVHFFVLRSGPVQLNQWLTERRNVLRRLPEGLRGGPRRPPAIALSIDTNDTRSTAEALIGHLYTGRIRVLPTARAAPSRADSLRHWAGRR